MEEDEWPFDGLFGIHTELVNELSSKVEDCLIKCSNDNVQIVRRFLENHINNNDTNHYKDYALNKRVLGYLRSLVRENSGTRNLHVLYILNDLLHHHRSNILKGYEDLMIRRLFYKIWNSTGAEYTDRLNEVVFVWKQRQYLDQSILQPLITLIATENIELTDTTKKAALDFFFSHLDDDLDIFYEQDEQELESQQTITYYGWSKEFEQECHQKVLDHGNAEEQEEEQTDIQPTNIKKRRLNAVPPPNKY